MTTHDPPEVPKHYQCGARALDLSPRGQATPLAACSDPDRRQANDLPSSSAPHVRIMDSAQAMPSLPEDAEGAATGTGQADADNRLQQLPEAVATARPGNHDDKPEWYMNKQVLLQTGTLIFVRGLANLLVLWSTVVLLGSFVSDLPIIDYEFVTIICFFLSIRVFNALVDEQYKCLCDWVMRKYTKKEKYSIQCCFSQIIHLILVAFPLLVYIVYIVFSWVRLKDYRHKLGDSWVRLKDYRHKLGDVASSEKEVKMNMACFGFYLISLLQGVLYLVWYFLNFVISPFTVKATVNRCKFRDSWGEDCVLQYLASIKSKCLSDLNAEISLVKFAAGLLDSDSNADLLSGARMVNHFLDQKLLHVQELIRSSRSRVEKLLMMLAWKQQRDDREIRFLAAKIVSHVACDMGIAQFPGTLEGISYLIDPSKDFFSYASAETKGPIDPAKRNEVCGLIEQGFRILYKLTLDNKRNCIQILQDQALLTHIIAWVRCKPYIGPNTIQVNTGTNTGNQITVWLPNCWETILELCLNVLVRLTSFPEKNALLLDRMIKIQVPIFIISRYENNPKLQVKIIQMFANVFYLDEDEQNNEKRKMFLAVIRALFVSSLRRDSNVNHDVIVSAGKALSMLSVDKINCRALKILDDGITGQLDTIMMGEHFCIACRSLAAEINDRVYNSTILKKHIYQEDVSHQDKQLRKVVQLLCSSAPAPQGDNDKASSSAPAPQGDTDKEYLYRLQAALVHGIDVLINKTLVVKDKKATDEEMKRRENNALLFKEKITEILSEESLGTDFVQVVQRLIETDRKVATTGRLELVRRTASLVRSMIGCRFDFLVASLRGYNIIELLQNAYKDLSDVDSKEIFDSILRRGPKWVSTMESLINDIQVLLHRLENTTPARNKGKQVMLSAPPELQTQKPKSTESVGTKFMADAQKADNKAHTDNKEGDRVHIPETIDGKNDQAETAEGQSSK